MNSPRAAHSDKVPRVQACKLGLAGYSVYLQGMPMKKGDFVGGMEVQPLGGGHVMILGGGPDNWVCTWVENGTTMTQAFQPEQLEPASNSARVGSSSE